MEYVLDLIGRVAGDVGRTFATVWPFLLISILAAAALTVYVGTDRVARLMQRRASIAVGGAVLLATLTPFCSCGTTAVLLGGLATASPWAPLVAFMVASPLTSPSELVFSAGLFGWSFALVFFIGTIVLGLASGAIAAALDRAGWLADQARMLRSTDSCATGSCPLDSPQPVAAGVGPGTMAVTEQAAGLPPRRFGEFVSEVFVIGRKLLVFFFGFTAVGYLAIEAIPTLWLTDFLGSDSILAVPLAALIGIPAYVNTEASLPLLATFMDGGMGPGPALAFLVTGAGASIGAISGLFVIARKRVVALVVALLFGGALAMGWFGQLLL
jgi:uncharacterized membrane protein YraQ (UPF0718 family)